MSDSDATAATPPRLPIEEELLEGRRLLGERLAELELLYRTAPVGLALVDSDLRFVRINDRLAAINGRSADAHIGVALSEVLPDLWPQVEPLYRRVFDTGESVLDIDVHGTTAAEPGVERDWLVNYYPLRDRDGRIFGVNAVVQDITESKRAQRGLEEAHRTLEQRVIERTAELATSQQRYRELSEELAHVQRVATIGEMAAELAHEINQPLAAIVNFADGVVLRLREPAIDCAAMLDAVRQIAGEARRAAEVIRRLRDFVRKGAIQSEPCEINRLVREVAGLLDAETRRHAVALRLQLADGLPAIAADPIQIQQVVLNLLRNGLDAIAAGTGGERLLVVETHAAPPGVLLAVRDDGVGLPAAAAGRIFDAFFTTKPDGLGIGLTISRSIAEAHGGALWAEPQAPHGTTFFLRLPAER
ncbi:MAG: sensor histidine kinase [Candidatus Binatia bacterium]